MWYICMRRITKASIALCLNSSSLVLFYSLDKEGGDLFVELSLKSSRSSKFMLSANTHLSLLYGVLVSWWIWRLLVTWRFARPFLIGLKIVQRMWGEEGFVRDCRYLLSQDEKWNNVKEVKPKETGNLTDSNCHRVVRSFVNVPKNSRQSQYFTAQSPPRIQNHSLCSLSALSTVCLSTFILNAHRTWQRHTSSSLILHVPTIVLRLLKSVAQKELWYRCIRGSYGATESEERKALYRYVQNWDHVVGVMCHMIRSLIRSNNHFPLATLREW